jgi:hypothetical protein
LYLVSVGRQRPMQNIFRKFILLEFPVCFYALSNANLFYSCLLSDASVAGGFCFN